jgi:hypothetical protein
MLFQVLINCQTQINLNLSRINLNFAGDLYARICQLFAACIQQGSAFGLKYGVVVWNLNLRPLCSGTTGKHGFLDFWGDPVTDTAT